MSTLPPDPYKTLGVSKDAQLPEIRSAHRKLVLKCHPDKVQDPTLKAIKQDEFQKVQQAYELLSDENERGKYDDNVKLAELRKEMSKGMSANTSAPRAPSARTYEVRTAEPRPDTFKTAYRPSDRPSPGTKMYSQYPKSYDEQIHRQSPIFEEPRPRRATSYEKPSRQDDDRERERDRDRERRRRDDREREEMARAADRREREKEMQRERDRADKRAAEKAQEKAMRKAAERAQEEKEREKEARRAERKRQEKADKEREKLRKREAEEKSSRHKATYIEPYEDEAAYAAKSDKKKSSTKEKEKDKRARSIPRDSIPREEVPAVPSVPADPESKMKDTMLYAASYMGRRTGTHPGLARAQTFHESSVRYQPPIAVPTPPAASAYPPPPMPTAEEESRRSKSRRSSETKPRDKSSHKKSSPSKDAPPVPPSPNIYDASPTSRHIPQFASTHSSPSTSPPKHPGRAATYHQEAYTRPAPGLARAQTFSHVPADPDMRGRGRSRLTPQILSEDSESEDGPYHRSQRRNTHSPEPIPAEYPRTSRYAVNAGRTVRVPPEAYSAMYDESTSRKHSSANYDRPGPPSRESSYTAATSPYFKVKTSRYDSPQYGDLPRYSRDDYASTYAY